jgi:hypothetical protein
MNELRQAAEMALKALEDIFGKEKVDVGAINALRQALDLQTAIEKGAKAWADVPNASEWVNELRGNVDAADMSEERVHKTDKSIPEPVAYRCWNNHKNADGTFDTLRIWTSLKPEGYGNEPLYTAPPKKEWVGLDVEKFAELVRADEREACAKVCDEILEHTKKLGNNDAMLTAISCAVAILARGEK